MEPVLTADKTAATPPPTIPAPHQVTYHIEEYKSLRAEIAASIKGQMDIYVYGLVANGGIGAWLLINKASLLTYGPFAAKAAALIPLGVTVLAWNWSSIFQTSITGIAGYTRKIEANVALPGLGWETSRTDPPPRILRRIRFAWLALVLGGVVLAVVL